MISAWSLVSSCMCSHGSCLLRLATSTLPSGICKQVVDCWNIEMPFFLLKWISWAKVLLLEANIGIFLLPKPGLISTINLVSQQFWPVTAVFVFKFSASSLANYGNTVTEKVKKNKKKAAFTRCVHLIIIPCTPLGSFPECGCQETVAPFPVYEILQARKACATARVPVQAG